MSKPQVVIVRKDKRINHKVLHAAAFAVTGGISGIATAAEVANHAAYNARTRQLQAQSEGHTPSPRESKARGIIGAVCIVIVMLSILIMIVAS